MRVSAFAPGKVNLSLFLGPTRPDGRHELVTLIESVTLSDELVMLTQPSGEDEVICPGVDGDNLAAGALRALRARGWAGPAVRIAITKRIPVAAGMAGGSADAAATLRLAMAVAPGRAEEVDAIAASLGSDVPSQLVPGLVLGTGAGEMVERFEPLGPHAFVIVPSPERLSTAAVYAEADRLGLGRSAASLGEAYAALCGELRPGATVPERLLVNDLAPAARSLRPAIDEALEAVAQAGADHAIVCGSGPTVAGLYWGDDALSRATGAAERLTERFPGANATVPVPEGFGLPILV